MMLSATLLLALAVSSSVGEERLYELHGRVLQEDGKPFLRVTAVVFLHGSTNPFSTRTLADAGGRFSFKKLRAGAYTLAILVPRNGELQQTVHVGASQADSRGRIEKIFHLQRRPPGAGVHTVPASQLSIPMRAREEFEKAMERLSRHDVEGGVALLKRAVEIAPQFSAAWNHLGTIAYQSRQFRQAEDYFREALAQDPEAYPPLVNLGGALLSQGRDQESLAINLRAVDVRPDDPLAHSQLGQSYFYLARLEEAERHLRKAVALDAGHFSRPQLVLAEIYSRRRDFPTLVQVLEDFLRHHPDSEMDAKIKAELEKARAAGSGRSTGNPPPE